MTIEQPLTNREIATITDAYKIGINAMHPNQRGISNSTFELDSEYFLTIFKRRSLEEVEVIAHAANSLPFDIPIARPRLAGDSYAIQLEGGPALITPRLPGKHYVGSSQIDKRPIPSELHQQLSRFFWTLNDGLSQMPTTIKDDLCKPDDGVESSIELSRSIEHLYAYAPENYDATTMPTYPGVVHDDLERQNILSMGHAVTGLVDLDSLMHGDIMTQFSHFVFNFAFCDPSANVDTPSVYYRELEKSAVVSDDVPALYSSLFRFAINDIMEMDNIIHNHQNGNESSISMPEVINQYEKGLLLARKFFRSHYSYDGE